MNSPANFQKVMFATSAVISAQKTLPTGSLARIATGRRWRLVLMLLALPCNAALASRVPHMQFNWMQQSAAAGSSEAGASAAGSGKAESSRDQERGLVLIGVYVASTQDRMKISLPEVARRVVKRLSRKKGFRAVATTGDSADALQADARSKGCDSLLAITLTEEQATVIRMGNVDSVDTLRREKGDPGRDGAWQIAVRYRLERISPRGASMQNDFKVDEEQSPDLQARVTAGELTADQVLKELSKKN